VPRNLEHAKAHNTTSKSALAALMLAVSLGAGSAAAQRVVVGPQVVGWGYSNCAEYLRVRATDPGADLEVGQWVGGYFSGLLALDVEGAAPSYNGLAAWLQHQARAGADVVSPLAARLVAHCTVEPTLSIEVASQRVAMELAAEARAGLR